MTFSFGSDFRRWRETPQNSWSNVGRIRSVTLKNDLSPLLMGKKKGKDTTWHLTNEKERSVSHFTSLKWRPCFPPILPIHTLLFSILQAKQGRGVSLSFARTLGLWYSRFEESKVQERKWECMERRGTPLVVIITWTFPQMKKEWHLCVYVMMSREHHLNQGLGTWNETWVLKLDLFLSSFPYSTPIIRIILLIICAVEWNFNVHSSPASFNVPPDSNVLDLSNIILDTPNTQE